MAKSIKNILILSSFLLLLSTHTLFAESIDEKFNNSRAFQYSKKGAEYLRRKNFESAIKNFEKSLNLFPNYYMTYSNLGYAYLYSGQSDKALESFKKALSLKSDCVEAIRGMGSVYMSLKQEDKAAKYFEKSIEIDSNSIPPYMTLGIIYNNQKRYNEAIPLFEKVIEKKPRFVPAYTNISISYTMKGDIEKGYEYMQKAQHLEPNNVTINGLIRQFENKIKTKEHAIKDIQKSVIFHEPKGNTMELVEFTPTKINLPFNIKYPAMWYVREVPVETKSLFLSREPIREINDTYKVGLGVFYHEDYFIRQEPADSKMGRMGKAVLKAIKWKEDKTRFIEDLKKSGYTILSKAETEILNQPTLRVEYKNDEITRVTMLYIKVGKELLMLFFEAPPREYDEYKDTFEKMIKSFSIRSDFKIVDEATIFEEKIQEQIRNRKR